MTFNDNSDLRGSKVQRRGRTTGVAVGAGGGVVILLFLLSQMLGVDLTGLAGTGTDTGTQPQASAPACDTGAEANASVDCRMDGAYVSLDAYWAEEAPALGIDYAVPGFVLFEGGTQTGCGAASSASGPFYCPPDQTLYIDTSFYDDLRSRFGASGGPLAELYVVAHEWGHHIQQESGSFATTDRTDTGPGSDTIRLEVQADCYAGAWAGAASTTLDANGVPFLEPITQAQVTDALDAAAAVGDDRIQQASGVDVQPETWTHGSAEQRQRWFVTGYEGGAGACDTFAVSAGEL